MQEWMEGFDASSSSGLSCVICHALVARQPAHTEGHRQWHRDQAAQLEKLEARGS